MDRENGGNGHIVGMKHRYMQGARPAQAASSYGKNKKDFGKKEALRWRKRLALNKQIGQKLAH